MRADGLSRLVAPQLLGADFCRVRSSGPAYPRIFPSPLSADDCGCPMYDDDALHTPFPPEGRAQWLPRDGGPGRRPCWMGRRWCRGERVRFTCRTQAVPWRHALTATGRARPRPLEQPAAESGTPNLCTVHTLYLLDVLYHVQSWQMHSVRCVPLCLGGWPCCRGSLRLLVAVGGTAVSPRFAFGNEAVVQQAAARAGSQRSVPYASLTSCSLCRRAHLVCAVGG